MFEFNQSASFYERFVQQINSAETTDELITCLSDTAKALEFERFYYYGCHYETMTKKNETVLSNDLERFKNQRISIEKMENNAIFTICKQTGNLTSWNHVSENSEPANSFAIGWSQVILRRPDRLAYLELTRAENELSINETSTKTGVFRAVAYALEDRMIALKRKHDLQTLALAASHSGLVCPLSKRELEILRWTADGKTAEEVALILGISARTIHFHLTNIMQVLTVSNKTAAVSRAQLRGWLY